MAEALVEIFTRVGVPKEMLTDQGAQFTSNLMEEISRLLSLKQLRTSPYNPKCNGLVERFNGTLKSMLRRMCIKNLVSGIGTYPPSCLRTERPHKKVLDSPPLNCCMGEK